MPRFCLSEEKTLLHIYGFRCSFSICIVVHNLSLSRAYGVPEAIPCNSHDSVDQGCIIPIFQMRKLSLREVTKFAQDYMVHKW